MYNVIEIFPFLVNREFEGISVKQKQTVYFNLKQKQTAYLYLKKKQTAYLYLKQKQTAYFKSLLLNHNLVAGNWYVYIYMI